MGTLARFLLVTILSTVGLGVLGQELVIFTDNRALQVQSHRVEGTWTYLRIGNSGEMAVPSASILKVDNERGVAAAASVPSNTPPQTPAGTAPQPSPTGSEAVRRPNLPPPVAASSEDEEEEGPDSEMDEPEPPEPPAKAPDVPPQNSPTPPPGLMQTPAGMPPRPGIFPQNQPPGVQPQKPVDED
jgi:hypothetical protein